MPLVRIDVQSGRTPAELRRLADVVQEVMLEVFAAPPRDRYQIITEHPVGHIIAEDTGWGSSALTASRSSRSSSRDDGRPEAGGLRVAGGAAGGRVRGAAEGPDRLRHRRTRGRTGPSARAGTVPRG